MTLGALGLAALLAAAGSRLAAAAFVGAALAAAGEGHAGGYAAPVAVWTAVTAAGLLVAGRPPRRLALPAVGAGAALVAASAPNAAVVLPSWLLSTACAVAGRGGESERRWARAVVATDVLVAAAVSWSALGGGFANWPAGPGRGPAWLLAAAAALRAPLAAGALDRAPEGGVVVVRAQAMLAVAMALGGPGGIGGAVGGPGGIGAGAAVAGGAGLFAAAALGRREGPRDALQELALVAMAGGMGVAGWRTEGWVWGALGAGTVVHLLRVAGPPGGGARPLWAVLRSGWLGSPLWPVVAGLGTAAAGRGAAGFVVAAGLVVGMAGRRPQPQRSRGGAGAVALTVAAVAASWGALASAPAGALGAGLPRPSWPLVALLGGAAAAGALFARDLAPPRPRAVGPAGPGGEGLAEVLRPARRVLEALAARAGARLSLAGLAALAVGLWVWAWTRGFL